MNTEEDKGTDQPKVGILVSMYRERIKLLEDYHYEINRIGIGIGIVLNTKDPSEKCFFVNFTM